MVRETVSNPATPTGSIGSSRVSQNGSKAGSTEQTSKGAQAQERIARRAYELYEQRGRQEGQALEDWVNAERQLVGALSK
jgi:outer membrane protein TolC